MRNDSKYIATDGTDVIKAENKINVLAYTCPISLFIFFSLLYTVVDELIKKALVNS